MECAVPLFGFAGAFAGVIIWMFNDPVDIRVSILGCMVSSFVLAYLAWIRPKKDLVALTTPLYSLIFFGFPLGTIATVVLNFMYAASLTGLLVRLKYRFGNSGTPAINNTELAESIKSYLEKTREILGSTRPDAVRFANVIFSQFAHGDYLSAAQTAKSAITGLDETAVPRSLQNAFAIVKEQAELLDKSCSQPERFHNFSPEDSSVLAKTPDPKFGKSDEYDTALDNALLLLFAASWIMSEKDRPHLLQYQAFVLKLLER